MTQRIEVRFIVEVPDDMTMDEAREWIEFEVGHRNDMRTRHPQMEHDLEPVHGSFWIR